MTLSATRAGLAGLLLVGGLAAIMDFTRAGDGWMDGAAEARVSAQFEGVDGGPRGTVSAEQTAAGLLIRLSALDIPAGVHEVRVSVNNVCSAPPAEIAGDIVLASVHAGRDGHVRASLLTDRARLHGRGDALLDSDGGSVLILPSRPVATVAGAAAPVLACAGFSI